MATNTRARPFQTLSGCARELQVDEARLMTFLESHQFGRMMSVYEEGVAALRLQQNERIADSSFTETRRALLSGQEPRVGKFMEWNGTVGWTIVDFTAKLLYDLTQYHHRSGAAGFYRNHGFFVGYDAHERLFNIIGYARLLLYKRDYSIEKGLEVTPLPWKHNAISDENTHDTCATSEKHNVPEERQPLSRIGGGVGVYYTPTTMH